MKKIGIILSGLGYEEGTSVWDVAYLLREMERCNAKPIPLVPDTCIEHRFPGARGKAAPQRNFLSEAKKMIRGDVFLIGDVDPAQFDGLLIPGGKGCITVLCSMLRDGSKAQILPEIRELIAGIYARKKTIGAIGYGSVLPVLALRATARLLIAGMNDAEIIGFLRRIGTDVVKSQLDEVVVDEENNLLSTPGTSPKGSFLRASMGIEILVRELTEYALPSEKTIENKSNQQTKIQE